MVTQISDRPRWPIIQAAKETGVSVSTIKRRHRAGDFPNAAQDDIGRWLIPVTDLIAAGLTPGRPAPATQKAPATSSPKQGIAELQTRLTEAEQRATLAEALLETRIAQAEQRAILAEALLEAERRHNEHLALALRQLAPPPAEPSSGANAPVAAPRPLYDSLPYTPLVGSPAPQKRWWKRR